MWVPLVASFFIPGLGQIVNEQYVKGSLIILAGVVVIPGCIFWGVLFIPLWLVPLALWILSIADAAIIAQRRERGEYTAPWQCF